MIISDMHHCVTYMYINFHQNQVSRTVKTVHTNIFANNSKLHKFANCNLNFEKSLISDMDHLILHISADFKINRLGRSLIEPRSKDISTDDGQTDIASDNIRWSKRVQPTRGWTVAASTQHKLYSLLLPPAMGARFYRFLGRPAKWTRWLAGAAAIKSG